MSVGLVKGPVAIGAIIVMMGFGTGYSNVTFISWFQAKVDRALLGRVLGVIMFAAFGLVPLSYAIAGAAGRISVSVMFIGSGVLALLATSIAGWSSSVSSID